MFGVYGPERYHELLQSVCEASGWPASNAIARASTAVFRRFGVSTNPGGVRASWKYLRNQEKAHAVREALTGEPALKPVDAEHAFDAALDAVKAGDGGAAADTAPEDGTPGAKPKGSRSSKGSRLTRGTPSSSQGS